MNFHVGTSGFSYKEWKGSFYPKDLKDKEMLAYYAERFSTVEINNTFYRMPKAAVLEGWAEQVPEGFRFVIKASRRISHMKRLKEVDDEADYLFSTLDSLDERLGPVLVQLPGNFKKDMDRLRAFLDLIPPHVRVAFEFRHEAWHDEEVFEALRGRNCSLVIADVDDAPDPELTVTADWIYLRLRRDQYTKPSLKKWIGRLNDQSFGDAFVFFKHEDAGTGPKLAQQFIDLADASD